ncbi:GNAT family N-acetyltransferase [Chloroflexota bacterium]
MKEINTVLQIQEFTENNSEEWDDFVNSHPEGRFSQLTGYKKVIEQTYGYEASYWLFRDSYRKVIGVFPSFVKRSKYLGNKLVSQPFCEYGGLLIEGIPDGESLSLIKSKIEELLIQYNLPYLEVHGGTGLCPDCTRAVFREKPLHQYSLLTLASADDVWQKMDRMARKAVRKAKNSGLEYYQETTESSITEDFYPLYLLSMKRFGTPPHPQSFFLNCLRYLPRYMKLFLVRDGQRIVSTLLGFTTGKRVHIISTASDESYWEKRPNDLAHWEFIRWAADKGYQIFDFGPVRYEGQRRFKEKWGAESFDYVYFFLPLAGGKPEKEPTYSFGAKAFASLWKNLMPFRLTGIMGPWFRRQLGD